MGAARLSSRIQSLNSLIPSNSDTDVGFRTLYKNGAQLLPRAAFSKYQELSTNLRPSLPLPWVDGTGQTTHPWDFCLFSPTGACLCILTPCSPAFLFLGPRICRTTSPGRSPNEVPSYVGHRSSEHRAGSQEILTRGPAHCQLSGRLFDESTLVGEGAGPPLSQSGKRPFSRGPSPCTKRRSELVFLAY